MTNQEVRDARNTLATFIIDEQEVRLLIVADYIRCRIDVKEEK